MAGGETHTSPAAAVPAGEAAQGGGDREHPQGAAGEGGDDPILRAPRPDPPYPAQETGQGEASSGGGRGGHSGEAHQAEKVPPQCVAWTYRRVCLSVSPSAREATGNSRGRYIYSGPASLKC